MRSTRRRRCAIVQTPHTHIQEEKQKNQKDAPKLRDLMFPEEDIPKERKEKKVAPEYIFVFT